jgi:formyltetrahydrofolate deformylase
MGIMQMKSGRTSATIIEARQFNDEEEGSFLMCVEFDPRGARIDLIHHDFQQFNADHG